MNDSETTLCEAADPEVFEWYVKNYGNDILFVDHSQIVQFEALRSGIWGTKSTGPAGFKPPALKERRSKLRRVSGEDVKAF